MAELFDALPDQVSLADMIKEVKAEIGWREHVYSRRIVAKKMTQALANKKIAVMRAVLALLEGRLAERHAA